MNSTNLNRAALVLSYAGVFVSGVLSLAHGMGRVVPCGPSAGCEIVANHPSSSTFGLPNAYLGLVLYTILVVLASMRMFKGMVDVRNNLLVSYVLTTAGFLFSMYLTYIAITVIHAECDWCLASAGIMTVLFVIHAMLYQKDAPTEAPTGTGVFDTSLVAGLALLTAVGLGIQASSLSQATLASHDVIDAPVEVLIPDGAHRFGNATSKITIVEFADLVCPACRTTYPVLRDLVEKSNGNISVVFRHYPWRKMKGHEMALPAAIMAEIAADQGKFDAFVNAMYSAEPESLTSFQTVIDAATVAGLDLKVARKRYEEITSDNPDAEKDPAFVRVMRDINAANRIGLVQTPTFVIVSSGLPSVPALPANLETTLNKPEYQKLLKGNG